MSDRTDWALGHLWFMATDPDAEPTDSEIEAAGRLTRARCGLPRRFGVARCCAAVGVAVQVASASSLWFLWAHRAVAVPVLDPVDIIVAWTPWALGALATSIACCAIAALSGSVRLPRVAGRAREGVSDSV